MERGRVHKYHARAHGASAPSRRLRLGAAVLLLAACAAAAACAGDVTAPTAQLAGQWTGAVVQGTSTGDLSLELRQAGDSLTGSGVLRWLGPDTTVIPLLAQGHVADSAALTLTLTSAYQPIVMTATARGDVLEGELTGLGYDHTPVNLARAPQ